MSPYPTYRSMGDTRDYHGRPVYHLDDLSARVHGLNISDVPLEPPFQHKVGYQPITVPYSPYIQRYPHTYHSPYPSYSPGTFPVETIHGMPSYPIRPPIPDSNQTSPLEPPFAPSPSTWGSPSVSSVFHQRQGPMLDDFGRGQPMYHPHTAWNPPPAGFPYPTFGRSSPFVSHGSTPASRPSPNRAPWTGPSKESVADRERKAYHPQPPAKRSDWVMWVGNVPQNTSHEELWRFFNMSIPSAPEEPWRGPSSIFLISRSSCAFVNLSSQVDLDRAVESFNGRSLRPWDPQCPRIVCRVRRKDDDLRAGVGAQRGTGMHRDWIKQQQQNIPQIDTPSPAFMEHPPDGEGRRRESVVAEDLTRHKSSASHASTNSSLLARHFPKRVFILKSLSTAELEDSVKSGTWQTQKHNEGILDQAYRNSPEVYLIFSANKSGEFFGYAKMVEPIDKTVQKWSSSSGSKGSRQKPEQIKEEEDPARLRLFLTPSPSHIAASSPSELTPAEEEKLVSDTRANTDPPHAGKASPPEQSRAKTLDPKHVQPNYFPPMPIAAASDEHQAEKQERLGGSTRAQRLGEGGVLRKDTILTPGEKGHKGGADAPEEELGWGHSFNVQWVRTAAVPFGRLKNVRNPWNQDKEVKICRDGTEVEPNVGLQLLHDWDKYAVQSPTESPLPPAHPNVV